jgi:hypothetical protein
MSLFTNFIKLNNFHIFQKHVDLGSGNAISPSLRDAEGQKYMTQNEIPQLHMNYTPNFSQGNTPVWQCLVRCPVDAAGTEESLVNNAG